MNFRGRTIYCSQILFTRYLLKESFIYGPRSIVMLYFYSNKPLGSNLCAHMLGPFYLVLQETRYEKKICANNATINIL